MFTILFRCPNTGYPVQGWFAHGMSRDCKDIFEGVICLACGGRVRDQSAGAALERYFDSRRAFDLQTAVQIG